MTDPNEEAIVYQLLLMHLPRSHFYQSISTHILIIEKELSAAFLFVGTNQIENETFFIRIFEII